MRESRRWAVREAALEGTRAGGALGLELPPAGLINLSLGRKYIHI